MPNKQIQSLTVEGVTYDIVDNTSGYTKNVGTITEVKTTAGAHTTIDVTNGKAEFKVPTKTSDLTNDSGFLTSYTETDPIFVASAAHRITSTDITNWNNKLDSYTETDPTVPAWAKATNKPSYTFSEIGSKPTTISGYGITDAYTKTQVDGLVAGVLHYKGAKASVADLPTTGNVIGDVWHITADGSEYAWDGSVWQELGTAIDLSGYATKATTLAGYEISDAKIENGTITLGSNSITPLISFTETDPVFIASPAYGITASDITNWNSKTSNTGTVTQVSTGTGLSGGPITTSGTITLSTAKTSKISSGLGGVQVWKNWESNTTITAPSSIGSFSGTVTVQNESTVSDRYYAVEATYDGHLIVNVPWTNVNSSYLTSETDPVFSASAAASITSTDISNWNAKVSDDKTWNGVTLNKSEAAGNDNYYLTGITDGTTTSTTARLIKATTSPEANRIPKYTVEAYLRSKTPEVTDNSWNVATTAFVKSVMPTVLEPLIGNSSEITAEQVKTALQEGRDICIQTTGSLEGVNLDLRFTSWNSAVDTDYSGQAVNAVVSQTIANYGGVYYLFELIGLIGGSWTLLSTTLAQKSDIPTVPTNVSAFTNDAGYITLSQVPTNNVFIATYGTTTASEVQTEYNAGKLIFCKNENRIARLTRADSGTFYFHFANLINTTTYILNANGWDDSNSVDLVTTRRKINNKSLSANINLTASDVGALPNTITIPEATTAINDNNYIYNGQTVDSMISGVGISNATNLLTSRNDTYVALRSSSSNPFLGLKCGNNLWYAQAVDNYFYFGPTSAKAMRLDQNGNALFVGTVQANSDLTLYTPSGNSPGIVFQRGTLTDNYNDWKIYDKGGYLYFAQRGSGSTDFGDVGYIDTGGNLNSFKIPWTNVTSKPTFAAVATSGSYNDLSNQPTIPTKTSDITNDSGYITASQVPTELPAVTSSDNGKVLRVVNGAWSAVALPSASGVSF